MALAADSDEDLPAVLGDERRRDLAKSFQRDASGKFNCAFCPYSTEHHGSMKNHQMTHTGKGADFVVTSENFHRVDNRN